MAMAGQYNPMGRSYNKSLQVEVKKIGKIGTLCMKSTMDVKIQCTKWDYRDQGWEQGRRKSSTEEQTEAAEKEEKSTTLEVDKDKDIDNLREEIERERHDKS